MALPRLLLFGTPGAGKTSLLGALAQSATAQSPGLKGELIAEKGDFEELRTNTYERVPNTTEALESYDLKLQPADPKSDALIRATVIDCGGGEALEMLREKEPFVNARDMRKSVYNADGVVIVVDSSLPGKALTEEFQQIARWLTHLREVRGKRLEIGEFPVYLVLSKCDLLAKKDDTLAKWQQRVEEGKRRIEEKFRKLLDQQGDAFGSIKLIMCATAIRKPALADRPTKTPEPVGVAELFHSSLNAAVDFQERRRISAGRLQNVTVGLIAVVTLFVLTLAGLFEFQPPERDPDFENTIAKVMPKPDAPPNVRLRGTAKTLADKQKRLEQIIDHAEFAKLPSEMREEVQQFYRELSEYAQLYNESLTKLKAPHVAKNQEELDAERVKLNEFALPKERAKDWEDTALAHRLKQFRSEYEALDKALKEEVAWIRERIKDNEKLRRQGLALQSRIAFGEKDAPKEVEAWNRENNKRSSLPAPTPREALVKGVSRLTYEDLARFTVVQDAKRQLRLSLDSLSKTAEALDAEMRRMP